MKKFVAMAIALGAVLALVTYWNSRRNPADSRGSDGGDNLPLTGEVFPTHGNWISENDLTPTATPTPTESLPTATPTPTEAPVLLYINEILPTNGKWNKHNNGFYDAIEIYNGSDETIQLSDYCLSDSKKHLTEYPLPETELPAGGYAVFYCTGAYSVKEEIDLPFSLSYFGEKVYLCDKAGRIIDSVSYPELPKNMSYGRLGEEMRIFDTPTLGQTNENGFERMATSPKVDLEPGFYEGAQKVSFTTGGTVYYTTDGSKPGPSSKKWDGKPITVSSTCTIRAYAREAGCVDSFTSAYTYFIGEPEYELDVVKISMRPSDFETMTANYEHTRKYEANIALFSHGIQRFSEDCAIEIFGGSSRKYQKKSYQVKFSTDYGPSKLRYPVFDTLDTDEFNSLVLRSGAQDNAGAMMRDEYVSSLSMSGGIVETVLVQEYKPVNLYVNGEYRGIYFIREHVDADMVASHLGCDPEEVTIVKQMKTVKCGREGNEWKELWKYITENKLTSTEAYEHVKSIVDIDSVIDYYIIELWGANIDMDNVKVAKARGKWFFILYDNDLTVCKSPEGMVAEQIGTFNPGYYTFNALIYRLLENAEFRELFCKRMEHLFTEVFNDENAVAFIDGLASVLDHDMQYNCERWNPVTGDVYYNSYKGWQKAVEQLRKLVTGRCARVVADFVKTKGISKELTEKYFSEFQQ